MRSAKSFVRASRFAALALVFTLAAPPVLQAQDGGPAVDLGDDLVPLPKLQPRKDGLRMSPRSMHNFCISEDIDDPMRTHFTVAELKTAIDTLTAQVQEISSWDSYQGEGEGGALHTQVKQITAQIEVLQLCQLEEFARVLIPRAAASCAGLKWATDKLDGPAVTLRKRGVIMRSEWLKILESFLAAANTCRRSLGQCLNPYNERQKKDLLAFLNFVATVNLASDGLKVVKYDLPPCSKTMLEDGADELPSDDILKFIDQAPVEAEVIFHSGTSAEERP